MNADVIDLDLYRVKRRVRDASRSLGITPVPFKQPSPELQQLLRWLNESRDLIVCMTEFPARAPHTPSR